MIFIISGEGPTDIGACLDGSGQCKGQAFRLGPMAVMIDQIIEEVTGYSLAAAEAFEFLSEHRVAELTKNLKSFLSIPGKKRGEETGYFFKNAFALRGGMPKSSAQMPNVRLA